MENICREYRKKDKEIKKYCRRDKKAWTEARREEAEEAAKKGDSKTLQDHKRVNRKDTPEGTY